jgi:hypothetical protein
MRVPWKFKSSVFGWIDLVNSPRVLYFLQKHVTKRSRIITLNVDENWKQHGSSLKKYNASGLVFEFGAGKSLAQNFYLSSIATKQVLVDLNPMLDLELVNTARRLLLNKCQLKSNKVIHSVNDLAEYGIEYRSPYDASDTDFDDESLDACISTNTLEHIPKENIIKIFSELNRTLKSHGIVSAKIDYSDHYAHTDPSLSLLNYLQYSEEDWRKFNHKCHYQNRLRHYDYLKIFDECGFRVLEEYLIYGEKNIPQAIAEMFDGKPEAWAATSAYVVLAKT